MTPSFTTLLLLVTLVLNLVVRNSHCYDERPNCAAYSGDIKHAVLDFTTGASLTQQLFGFPRPQPDISNLRETLYRGMNFADQSRIETATTPVNSLYRMSMPLFPFAYLFTPSCIVHKQLV